MTRNNLCHWCLCGVLSGVLIALSSGCQDVHHTLANHNGTQTAHDEESHFMLNDNIDQFVAHTWRFEKGENISNEWLSKLDDRAIVNFARHTDNPNDLTAPTPSDDLVFLGFSSYIGCASVNGVIGLDRTKAKFYKTNAGYFGNAPHCGDITQMENELAYFVGRGNIEYEFKDSRLILRDNTQQTLYFKASKYQSTP